ncbi:MAG: fatty acyl-AMP ligase [Deltaproteobacteria bacterium]|nr:fatty acyl-AMP ligase [Deltaproteobacteria bacterium]
MTHSTITDALLEQARRRPDRPAFTVVDGERGRAGVTYGELCAGSLGVAARLGERGLRRGERVLVCLPTSLDLLRAIYGVLLGGGACVPVYPPLSPHLLDRWKEQLRATLRVAQPCGAIVAPAHRLHVAAVLAEHGEDLFVVTPAELADRGRAAPVPAQAGDLALVQFTSGTTSRPRGVAISHGALMANVRALVAALDLCEADVSVSWLPPYHDMGLVGHVFTPVAGGVHQYLMPPIRFLMRPARWLGLVSEVGATQTTAPNSAYSICVRRVPPEARAGLQLQGLRWALNGAEVVQAETMRAFADAYAAGGLRAEALRPVYGLAEATLAATLGPPGGARFDWVERRQFSTFARAEPARPGAAGALGFACVGEPIAGHELVIVGPDGKPCAERQVGEIRLRGPSVMEGYFNDPQATRQVLRDGWLCTGDLGYLAAGMLHVTGRSKELIIKAGRNLLPADLEAACQDEPRLRPGRAVAFGVPNPRTGTEDVVLVAEVRERAWVADGLLRQRIAAAVAQRTTVRPDRVELVEPGTLPKTTSGKLQRAGVRDAYARGVPLGRSRRALALAGGLAEGARSLALLARMRVRRLLGWE